MPPAMICDAQYPARYLNAKQRTEQLERLTARSIKMRPEIVWPDRQGEHVELGVPLFAPKPSLLLRK